jgi:hypothetical protein
VPKTTAYRAIYSGPQRQASAPAPGRTERAAMAYSEITDGSVAEYEAIESTVMNRMANARKYGVRPGGEANEGNLIFAPNQYQGVGGPNYQRYIMGEDDNQGTRNAQTADQDLRRTGRPTTKAVSFIVHQDGSPPTDHEVMNLGPNLKPADPKKVG